MAVWTPNFIPSYYFGTKKRTPEDVRPAGKLCLLCSIVKILLDLVLGLCADVIEKAVMVCFGVLLHEFEALNLKLCPLAVGQVLGVLCGLNCCDFVYDLLSVVITRSNSSLGGERN